MSSSQQINATSTQVQATNEGTSIPVAATLPVISAPVLPLGLSSVPTPSVISPFTTPVPSAGPRVTFPPSMTQFMNDTANLQAIQGFGQVMAMCQQNGGMPFLPSMFTFALRGAGTMPLQAPMTVTPFQTPMPQPSPFQPQLVSTMAPVNLTGALNAVGPSRPPQGTNPQITPDGHCVSVESDDGEWNIPRAHKKKKGKNIRPATSRNSAFERLGDREEGQRKSAKQRLGQSIAHVSAFARLGEAREADPARTQRSRSNRQEPVRTRASRQEEEAESQPRLPVANRLTIPNDRVQQMEAKLERLEKKVGEKNDRDKPLAGSPFTTRVHLTPFPRKTLRNRATEWFNKVRPGSIDSFSDLASKFKAKFQENCTKRKKFTYLSTAGQRESENLTQFLTRWKEEVDKVEEMDDKTVLSLLLNGLRAGELYKEFCWKPPATYQEAYHTAWEFAEAETQLRAKKEAEHGFKPKPVQVKKEETPRSSRPRHHYDPVVRMVNTEECQEIQKAPVIPPENPTGQTGRQWSGTYCSYHRSDSHNTSECKSVKGVIRQMIDSGELGKDYLQKAQEKSHQWVRPAAPGDDRDNDRQRNNRPRERQPAPEKEHIGMIFGGSEGGDSTVQRKNWVWSIYVGEVSAEPPRRKHTRREPIVFTDRDLPPTGEDHNDPLVITMDINGVDVARVLVDTGSSVNILYVETFQKLRPGINRVGAVISMPHLCMKFHTPGGVGEVKGDQRNARECYARAVKKMTKGVNVISQEIAKGETWEKLEPEAETVEIELHLGDSSRMVRIGANLPEDLKAEITRVLQEYVGIFAWSVADMPGIDRSVICHRLAVREGSRPALKISRVSIKSDSSLIVGQVTGNMEAREGRMAQYKDLVLALLKGFEEFKIAQIPWAENADADLLSKLTQYAPEHVSKLARVKILDRASIEKLEVAAITAGSQSDRSNLVGADDHWMYDLMEYLMDGSLPEQDDRERKVKLRAPRFQVLDGKLYKRAFGGPLLRCLTNREAERVIAEVHEGVCAAHQMSRTLSQRIILLGYYWPTIVQDCERYVQKCRTCQVFYKYPGRPATYYHPVSNVIPFVIVAIDYFTKWIEAEALANITTQQCKKFIWKNIITRFGAPLNLIIDNGPQFRNPRFTEYLKGFGIKHNRSSVAYPQGNGQVENANRTIVDGLKKRLGEAGNKWLEELPHIVWAFRVTPRRAHGETPFSLTYGCEARLPIEAEFPTFRESNYQPQQNEEDHLAELNLVEERRMAAEVKMSTYQQVVKKYHDNKVGLRYFQVGDEVLRRREASRPGNGGKLAKN
ncbi:unnamed protein product [Cuscuta campestris]|uniref:Integrase catalytic domain-containing protein n=1 Tax=Cuscuta campestris TaxID=132261 RepID=A0A484LTS7_9ASTE|nr:unnamed protein product [Cuscuta campestris]